MLPIKDLRHKEMKLEDIFPNLPKLLQKAIETKEEIKKEVFEEVFKTVTGPQFNAVRVCNFPINDNSSKKKSDESDVYCEHFKMCPIFLNGIRESIGTKCLFEVQKVEQLTNELIEDLGVNVLTDHNDRRMIGELVMYCLIEDRAVASLACNSIEMTKITYGKNGTTYEKIQNVHLNTITIMNNLKTRVREKLVATKSDRLKMNLEKQKVVNADGAAKLKSKFKEIDKKLKPLKGIGLIQPQNNEKQNKEKEIEIIDVQEIQEIKKEEKIKPQEKTSFISFEDMFNGGE